MNARAHLWVSAVLLLALAGCDQPAPFAGGQAQAGAEAPDPGYRAAPQLTGMVKAPDGGVTLTGRALPSSEVRMVSPAGAAVDTRADGSGVWSAPIGPVSEPTLYRLAEEVGSRRVDAEGLVAVLPGAPTVALLRAGAGAEVVRAPGKEPVRILAVDYDQTGGAVVSGRAGAASPVRVTVDGQVAVEGAAGPDGRFSLTLPKPLGPGQRRLQVLTPQGAAEAEVAITPPAAPKDAPYTAAAEPFGWRVDWITPGGGPQTTLLLGG
jgi:hypothetical protein